MARLPDTNVAELLSSAERFSRSHPAVAGALGQLSTDASLERVREGLFYLGATCLDRVRELEGDGQRALAEVVAPDLLRGYPAATIVELLSTSAGQQAPAGAELETAGDSPCRFALVGDLDLGPWRTARARIERGAPSGDTLTFDLVATGDRPLCESMRDGARLFVDGPREAALLLVAHVLGHAERVELSTDGASSCLLGGPHPYGTKPEDVLAPEPDGPHTGITFLREYFLLPEKFCFFHLGGFAKALRGSDAKRATVTLRFDAPLPALASVAPDGIRAHCAPAVNLFAATAEPWVFEPGRPSAPVRVAGLSRRQAAAYAVLNVSAQPLDGAGQGVSLSSARRFGAGRVLPGFPYTFSTKIVAAAAREEPDVVVSLTSPRGSPPVLRPHVVSADILATNGERASTIRPGELTRPGSGMPPGVRARNIVAGSPYVRAPVGPELALQVAARSAIPGGDPLLSLKTVLFSLVPRRGVDPAAVRAHEARVAGIRRLDVTTVADPTHGRRGYQAMLAIDETPFRGLGDVALLLRLLHATLEAQVSVSHFYRCKATCLKGAIPMIWPPEAP